MAKARKKTRAPLQARSGGERSAPSSRRKGEPEALNLSTRKQLLFSAFLIALVFGGLESLLAIVGVHPLRYTEDPFVGFASSIPLYVEKKGTDGTIVMTTAQNKLSFFNPQEFPKKKPAGTYRILCMGESTTFGSPYTDVVSFPGWLRELLPVADPGRKWEVINAGGISYASYRVALLMEELGRYEPDLFIVYSGHNEFLEERTYRGVREMPAWIAGFHGLLSHTRIYSAARSLVGRTPGKGHHDDPRELLEAEVNTILDRSVGPSAYVRDDALREKVIEHYRISLDRMVSIARAAGAEILFVTTASNLKDCSPFKSEHSRRRDGARSDALLAEAQTRYARRSLPEALEAAQDAEAIDNRFAQTAYIKGRILDDLARYPDAKASFIRARDEDVCPLRALSAMVDIPRQVAAARGAGLVDFIELVERTAPHGIPGQEQFLDHVHPTIAVNGLLARALVDALAKKGVVRLAPSWNEPAIEVIGRRIAARVTPEMRVFALNQLSILSGWSGRFEEAARLLDEALRLAPDDPRLLHRAAANAQRAGRREEAVRYFQRVLEVAPDHPDTHHRLGVILGEMGQLDAAAGHLLEEVRLHPENAEAHFDLGVARGLQKKVDEAMAQYQAALRLNPRYTEAHHNLAVLASEQGRVEEAVDHCTQAIRIRPSFLPSRWLLGRMLGTQGRLAEAAAQYEEGVRRAPEMAPQAYLELGRILVKAGDRTNALKYLRLAERSDPGTPGFVCQLAAVYRDCQSIEDAERTLARCRVGHVLELSPRQVPAT